MGRKRIAIVGGSAAGVALAWCLTSRPELRRDWNVTLLHDEDDLGGQLRTVPVWFDEQGRGRSSRAPAGHPTYPVDVGVQFLCRTLYPNLYHQLAQPEFRERVPLVPHPALHISGAFGGGMVWGNFPEYQRGARFAACLDKPTRRLTRRFERDLRVAFWRRIGGRRVWTLAVGEYLNLSGVARDSHFVRYLLVPYLCMINRCAAQEVFETPMRDLVPIFTRLPFVQGAGPYGSFRHPGYGWDRFADGVGSWIDAMAGSAEAQGTWIRRGCRVKRVSPGDKGVMVEWDAPAFSDSGWAFFDTVVLTTDMATNRELLDHPDNPHWISQGRCLAAEPLAVTTGECYVHQDDSLLAPDLADGREDAQFTGAFAHAPAGADRDRPEQPHDARYSVQTYLMRNIVGTPYPCYVSMYREGDEAPRPDPAAVIARRAWRHSAAAASIFRPVARGLHRIQGLGNVFFGGTSATTDSEEGALLAAMIIAGRVAGYPYPFPRNSYGYTFYRRFAAAMFPR